MGVEANHFLVQRGSMLSIRPATVNDVKLLVTLIRELAEYEKELDAVKITEAQLARDGFGPRPLFHGWDGCGSRRLPGIWRDAKRGCRRRPMDQLG